MNKHKEASVLGENISGQIKGSKKRDSEKSKKGFLQQRGYTPESVGKRDISKDAQYVDTSKALEDLSYRTELTKRPRPEPVIKKKKMVKKTKSEISPLMTKESTSKKLMAVRYSLIIIAFMILLLSILLSYQNYLSWSNKEEPLEEIGYNFKNELVDNKQLTINDEQIAPGWEVNNYLRFTSEDIKQDLEPGVQFLIEVYDLSNYTLKYNRTIMNGLAWSSRPISEVFDLNEEDTFEISTFVNIYVSSNEIHLAMIEISIWK